MTRWAVSTHKQHWLFTPPALAAARADANAVALTRLAAASAAPPPPAPSANGDAPAPPPSFPPRPLPPPLSVAEEATVLSYHRRRLLRVAADSLALPDAVTATAVTFFCRAFARTSVLSACPAAASRTALYAATKVEEVLVPASEIVARFDALDARGGPGALSPVTEDDVLTAELRFLSRLRFHLVCFHPFRPLAAAIDGMTDLASEPSDADVVAAGGALPSVAAVKVLLPLLASAARKVLRRRFYQTDLLLTVPPGVAALAALSVAAGEVAAAPLADAADADADAAAATAGATAAAAAQFAPLRPLLRAFLAAHAPDGTAAAAEAAAAATTLAGIPPLPPPPAPVPPADTAVLEGLERRRRALGAAAAAAARAVAAGEVAARKAKQAEKNSVVAERARARQKALLGF